AHAVGRAGSLAFRGGGRGAGVGCLAGAEPDPLSAGHGAGQGATPIAVAVGGAAELRRVRGRSSGGGGLLRAGQASAHRGECGSAQAAQRDGTRRRPRARTRTCPWTARPGGGPVPGTAAALPAQWRVDAGVFGHRAVGRDVRRRQGGPPARQGAVGACAGAVPRQRGGWYPGGRARRGGRRRGRAGADPAIAAAAAGRVPADLAAGVWAVVDGVRHVGGCLRHASLTFTTACSILPAWKSFTTSSSSCICWAWRPSSPAWRCGCWRPPRPTRW